MEYQAKRVPTNHNVSKKHPLKDFAVLAVGVTAIAVLFYGMLGLMVDIAVDNLPDDFDEQGLFGETITAIETNKAPSLQVLVDKLSICADISYPVNVSVVDTDEVNALALPGKNILVYQGLLDAIDSEIGIAFVLAHELAHFKNKDHLRGLGRGIVLGTLSALLTGSNSALTHALTPASTIGESRYSKQRESAADLSALKTIQCHYGTTEGTEALFQYLADNQSTLQSLSHYLASHPDPNERIEMIRRFTSP
jgi:Zn-dependent protease with chaperone function